jgi:dienelactone hydrolase
MAGSFVSYSVNGQSFQGYYSGPAAADTPLILLIHDWDGLTDYEVKRADMLATMGYTVFAADLYGTGIRPVEDKDKRQHTGELYKNRKKMRALMHGALTAAQNNGATTDRIVAMGYCFGGSAVLELARSGADFDGFVTFHGGLVTPDGQDYSATQGKLLILHGSADNFITMDQFATLTRELESSDVDHEMITYSGAPHAFTVFGSSRYRQDADQKSWQRFTDFLSEIFK